MDEPRTPDLAAVVAALPRVAAEDVAGLLATVQGQLPAGVRCTVFLADYEEEVLSGLGPDGRVSGERLPVDGSTAGHCFMHQERVSGPDPGHVWLPLTNRWRRVGVLRLESDRQLEPAAVQGADVLGGLLALILDGAARSTDLLHQAKRRRPINLSAELQWDLLPPLSIAGRGVSLAGKLEPAYAVGGDAFDYAINPGAAQLGIFDPLGHDLRSSLLAWTAVGAYRNGRRSGLSLTEIGNRIDASVLEQFPQSCFVTGLLGRLELTTGRLHLLNAGHPAPMRLRDGRVQALATEPDRPWGMGAVGVRTSETTLQPGDRVLLFTDGIVEARPEGGESFGRDRLAELLSQQAAPPVPTNEVLRRLLRAVLEHRAAPLVDDATAVLLEWHGPNVVPELYALPEP